MPSPLSMEFTIGIPYPPPDIDEFKTRHFIYDKEKFDAIGKRNKAVVANFKKEVKGTPQVHAALRAHLKRFIDDIESFRLDLHTVDRQILYPGEKAAAIMENVRNSYKDQWKSATYTMRASIKKLLNQIKTDLPTTMRTLVAKLNDLINIHIDDNSLLTAEQAETCNKLLSKKTGTLKKETLSNISKILSDARKEFATLIKPEEANSAKYTDTYIREFNDNHATFVKYEDKLEDLILLLLTCEDDEYALEPLPMRARMDEFNIDLNHQLRELNDKKLSADLKKLSDSVNGKVQQVTNLLKSKFDAIERELNGTNCEGNNSKGKQIGESH